MRYEPRSAIISLKVGDLEQTFAAGRALFDRGFYAQSATYPAVPIQGGLLRVQINANHPVAAVDGLLAAVEQVWKELRLPLRRRAVTAP
jgi:7-keto-8-aminopelargonate synthetase-like enzyme